MKLKKKADTISMADTKAIFNLNGFEWVWKGCGRFFEKDSCLIKNNKISIT